jgi:hypothetical protein
MNFFLFKPSIIYKKKSLLINIKWRTKYKKYFVNINNFKNIINIKLGNFFPITTKSSKILWYLNYEEQYTLKIKSFFLKIIYFIMNMYKLNFIINDNFIINNNLTNFFFFNLKYQIIINYINIYCFIKLKTLTKQLLNFKELTYYDRNFIKIISIFYINIKNWNNLNDKLLNYKIKKKYIKLNKFSYLNYIINI